MTVSVTAGRTTRRSSATCAFRPCVRGSGCPVRRSSRADTSRSRPRATPRAPLSNCWRKRGIGRPSTFATIVSTITTRGYVKREGKALVPTQLGEVTNDIMLRNFATIVDEHFTARMENDLDGIEEGKESMEDVLQPVLERL